MRKQRILVELEVIAPTPQEAESLVTNLIDEHFDDEVFPMYVTSIAQEKAHNTGDL